MNVLQHTNTHTHTEREREREKWMERLLTARAVHVYPLIFPISLCCCVVGWMRLETYSADGRGRTMEEPQQWTQDQVRIRMEIRVYTREVTIPRSFSLYAIIIILLSDGDEEMWDDMRQRD